MTFHSLVQALLAFDSPWWTVSAIALSSTLRVVGAQAPYLRKYRASILELVDSLLIALLLVFCILRPFVVQAFYIPSGSMENTLLINDRILVNKFVYFFREPERGDIVVFRAPPAASPTRKDFIKRVVGLPGDHIAVFGGKVYRNGQPIDEPYIRETPDYNWPVIDRDFFQPGVLTDKRHGGREWEVLEAGVPVLVGECVVQPDSILVMGDNRNQSDDSHLWDNSRLGQGLDVSGHAIHLPFVPRENILGRAGVIFWPLSRIRGLQ